ncbi:MAG: hypothetical protein QM755_15130, partial [Luteolibacter sp.]
MSERLTSRPEPQPRPYARGRTKEQPWPRSTAAADQEAPRPDRCRLHRSLRHEKALVEADGDLDKAIEVLRVKGAAKAAKRGEEREAT